MTTTSKLSAIDQRQGRLEQPLERLEELGRVGAVNHAMVGRESHAAALAGHDLAVDDDRLVKDRPDGQDRRLWRVDDRVELLDAVHAQVGDRERAALVVLDLELAGP